MGGGSGNNGRKMGQSMGQETIYDYDCDMIVNMIVIMIMIMNMININLINHVQNLYLLFAYSAYFLPNVFSNNKI